MTIALTRIPGIGPSTAKVLAENGFKSAQQLAGTTIAQLAKVPGFGTARASRAINAAIELLAAAGDSTAKAAQTTKRPRRAAQKPAPRPTTGTKADTDTKETK